MSSVKVFGKCRQTSGEHTLYCREEIRVGGWVNRKLMKSGGVGGGERGVR